MRRSELCLIGQDCASWSPLYTQSGTQMNKTLLAQPALNGVGVVVEGVVPEQDNSLLQLKQVAKPDRIFIAVTLKGSIG